VAHGAKAGAERLAPHSSRSSLAQAWSSVWRRTADGGHLVAQVAGASLKRKGASLSSASQAFSAFPLTTRTPRLYTLQNTLRIQLHRLISARVLSRACSALQVESCLFRKASKRTPRT
jgi:hypothetical protein